MDSGPSKNIMPSSLYMVLNPVIVYVHAVSTKPRASSFETVHLVFRQATDPTLYRTTFHTTDAYDTEVTSCNPARLVPCTSIPCVTLKDKLCDISCPSLIRFCTPFLEDQSPFPERRTLSTATCHGTCTRMYLARVTRHHVMG